LLPTRGFISRLFPPFLLLTLVRHLPLILLSLPKASIRARACSYSCSHCCHSSDRRAPCASLTSWRLLRSASAVSPRFLLSQPLHALRSSAAMAHPMLSPVVRAPKSLLSLSIPSTHLIPTPALLGRTTAQAALMVQMVVPPRRLALRAGIMRLSRYLARPGKLRTRL
jgi:hypothetical protein